ncbi:MAG: hypothetical protein A2474_03030 [Elusimicrobia bacterium RIFOXYC2_FULL_34_12]|nr:MAG: hypothetical protein A2474_03030 [Elusimicrobia bacterium RIFOXYC2_FULL_34_12]
MNEKLATLIELQNIDIKKDEIINKISNIHNEIKLFEESMKKKQEEIESAKGEISKDTIFKKDKDLEIASVEEKIRKHNMELNGVKTNDAYRALLNEIENGKQIKLRIEDELLIVMEKDEKLLKSIKDLQNQYIEIEKEFANKKNVFEIELKKHEEDIAKLEEERKLKIDVLPKNISEKYENVRNNKHGIAVVPIDNNTCGGCHRNLPIHVIDEVQKGKELVICNNCLRILYKKL